MGALSSYARIPLRSREGTVRGYAIVDSEDYAALAQFRWFLGSHGYAMRTESEGNRTVRHTLMHRQIFGLTPGDGREMDHVNRDRLDNRRENLRLVTHAENMQNRAFGGVHLYRRTGRWMAYTRKRGGRREHLGYYATREEAEAAVALAEGEHRADQEVRQVFQRER